MVKKLISVFLVIIISLLSFSTIIFANTPAPRTSIQIINDSNINNEINDTWNDELSSALNVSCDYLLNEQEGNLLYTALGSAGRSSSNVSFYINEVSLKENFSTLLELSYTILNTTFCGYNATNILGKNLLSKFNNFDNLERETLKTLCYSLIAINSNPYTIKDSKDFNIDIIKSNILRHQNQDGGFKKKLSESNSDVISTALSLIALSEYKQDENIMQSIKKALDYISESQNKYGDFLIDNNESSIALSYVIIAFISLNIPLDTPEYNPTDENLISLLLNKYSKIDGSFSENLNGDSSIEATELAVLALSATKNNKSPFKLNSPLVVSDIEIEENTVKKTVVEKPKNKYERYIYLSLIIITISTITVISFKKHNNKNKRSKC